MIKLLTLILVATIFQSQPDPTQEGKQLVIDITKENFNFKVEQNPHQKYVVLFMKKKSKSSKKVFPIFNKTAFDFQDKDIKFAQVNCKKEKNLCTLLRVRYYPNLYIIVGGKLYQLKDEITEYKMKQFIKEDWTQTKGIKIPEKMPTYLEDVLHIIQIFIEEGKNTFKSEGRYFMKSMYGLLLGLLAVILILLLYLGYIVFDFFRPVKYPENNQKLKKD